MKKPENPYAFPNTDPEYFGASDAHGMTLRDYFAAKAMQAIISNEYQMTLLESEVKDKMESGSFKETYYELGPKLLSNQAYKIADAMLKERVKP